MEEKDEVKKGTIGQEINNTAGFDLVGDAAFKTLYSDYNYLSRQKKAMETTQNNYNRFKESGNLVTDWTNDFMKQEADLKNYENNFNISLNNIAASSLGKNI